MSSIVAIRNAVDSEILDYQQLIDLLRGYAKPRDKIRSMLKAGELIRVKKGLYVFGEQFRRRPWSREVLANLIYGPSYISLDYALSYYGLIPERVLAVSSVTLSRSRRFETPVGAFTYRNLSPRRYSVSIDLRSIDGGSHFLMATAVKALADKIWTDHRFRPRKPADFRGYLVDDLRIAVDALNAIDRDELALIAERYASRKIRLLRDYLSTVQGAQT